MPGPQTDLQLQMQSLVWPKRGSQGCWASTDFSLPPWLPKGEVGGEELAPAPPRLLERQALLTVEVLRHRLLGALAPDESIFLIHAASAPTQHPTDTRQPRYISLGTTCSQQVEAPTAGPLLQVHHLQAAAGHPPLSSAQSLLKTLHLSH